MARVDLLSDSEWLAVVRDRLRADGDDCADGHLHLLDVQPSAAKGQYAGFVADNLPVRARVLLTGGAQREIGFFMKAVPTDIDAQLLMARDAFVKEVGLYADAFPLMRELPPREKLAPDTPPWAPRIFFTRPDLLVMEDLIEQGFVERDRREPFDFEHAAVALEALGRYHASSLLLEEQRAREVGRSCSFEELFPELVEELMVVDVPKNQFGRYFGSAVRSLHKTIGLIPKYKSSPEYESIMNSFLGIQKKMVDMVHPSKKYRNALNHGDLWSNNILFRYSDDGRPLDVRLVDFQLTRYCPPAVDIMFLLHLTTLPSLRLERGAELLRRYHAALSDSLQRGGADAQRLLPWDELVASCDEYHDVGRIIAPCHHHLSLITPEIFKKNFSQDFEKFVFEERDEIVKQCFRDDDYYRQMVCEEMSELVDGTILGKNAGFWKRVTASVG